MIIECLQDGGILLVGSNEVIGVFREHVRLVGGQVSVVPPNVSVAPSYGHNCVLPV